MKFFIRTYGCQMNERDTESVAALLRSSGWESAPSEDLADMVIVNTCSVRSKAENKALGKLAMLVSEKKSRPGRIVGAIGCVAQRMGDSIAGKIPGLDFSLGTHAIAKLPEVLERLNGRGSALVDTTGENGAEAVLDGHVYESNAISAFVNILYGCNRRCSYCVVPHVRGPEWSRGGADVVREVGLLAANGVKEVTLLGQSVMSYGRANCVWPEDYVSPRGYREPLPRLLEAVGSVRGISRVRFTSGHPVGCTHELARAMSENTSVCEHLHVPVQSGADRILEAMRRGYTARDFADAVSMLRDRMPDIGITTDIIVGFPGETLEDFEATRRMMNEIRFDNSFIFKYSPRPGTEAAEMKDDVPPPEKMRRNRVLLEDQDRVGLEINAALVGQTVEVMVEGPSLRNRDRLAGRTRTNKITVFDPAVGIGPGDFVKVKITRAAAQTLYGRLAEA